MSIPRHVFLNVSKKGSVLKIIILEVDLTFTKSEHDRSTSKSAFFELIYPLALLLAAAKYV